VPGGDLLRPQREDVSSALLAHLEGEGYPWVAARIRGETSRLGYLATFANAGANAALFAAWLVSTSRRAAGPVT
jgi:hypothetical protein